MKKPKLVVITGPTATGKSSLALDLALKVRGEIISADSVQVYRGLDTGTAKPSPEERALVPHHLIDILDPDQEYSAALFRREADEIIKQLHARSTPILVAGGTALYLKVLTRGLFRGPAGDPQLRSILHQKAEAGGNEALHQELRRLDPEAASRIHMHDRFRITRALEVCILTGQPITRLQSDHGFRENPYETLKVGLRWEREELYRRIDSRVERMVKMGWVEEVQSLLNKGFSPSLKSMQSLGYKHMVAHILGKASLGEAVELTKRDTRRYAKRQLTWFQNDPEVHWFTADQEITASVGRRILEFFRQC